MNAIANKTVRDIVVENPGATRVFEKLGIDYCCGGEKPLEEACAAANLAVSEVLAKLEAQQYTTRATGDKNWQAESMTSLIEHINSTHHVYMKSELPRIEALIAKVCGVHGEKHPELFQLRNIYSDLSEELSQHLMKEEQILFPYLVGVEQAATGAGEVPHSCFGTVQNPIRMMMFEHDNAGNALRQMRQITNNYTVPTDGCVSYQTLFQALQAMEADLHQHIHLENNILFPRAIEQEG